MAFRVVVLVSGSGTLLQALLDACAEGKIPAAVVAVGADRPDAFGLVRAERAGVPTFVHLMPKLYRLGSPERLAWDQQMADLVAAHEPDLIVLAGFMKLFDRPFLERFKGRIINTHPSMLPAFPGAHGVRDCLACGATSTGASIFWVDEGMDSGDMIDQRVVPVLPGDDEDTLHERIKVVERELLCDTVRALALEATESTAGIAPDTDK